MEFEVSVAGANGELWMLWLGRGLIFFDMAGVKRVGDGRLVVETDVIW